MEDKSAFNSLHVRDTFKRLRENFTAIFDPKKMEEINIDLDCIANILSKNMVKRDEQRTGRHIILDIYEYDPNAVTECKLTKDEFMYIKAYLTICEGFVKNNENIKSMSNSIYELCEKYLNPEEEKNNG